MVREDKVLDALKKIIQNKKYSDNTYPKIILKCPANTYGESKMEKAFWNVYFILSNYFKDSFYKTDESYCVTFTENGAYDMPSDYLDLDKLDVFYVDVANALDVDGEYIIGCSGFYTSIEETDNILKMSSKNSLIIDVDEFNNICDDLYVNALYHSTIDKLFTTDSYEYSFAADAKIVKAVCKAVNNYIDNLSGGNPIHTSHIKTDEIESLEDDYNVKVTFYIEEEKADTITLLKYYAKFKKYRIDDIIKDEISKTDVFKNETNIDDVKHLVDGTLNEIDADVKLNVITIFSEAVDVYFIKSVKMVKDILLYYANEKYSVDINTSEYNDACKNINLNPFGFIVAKFIVAIKPKTIKVEYSFYPTKEKLRESLWATSCDKHSYRAEIIDDLYREYRKEGNTEMKNSFVKISSKTELYNVALDSLIYDKHIMVIADHNGFFDLARANTVMEKIFELAKQEIQERVKVLTDKSFSDPMVLSKYLDNKDNNLKVKPFIKYVYARTCESPMLPEDIKVFCYAGVITDKTDIFKDGKGICINASDLFPIYMEIINEKENEKENVEMKTNVRVVNTKSDRENVHILVPKIDHVNYNEAKKTVIVFWATGETTKVKAMPEDKFDLYFGVQAAITKYVTGNTCERTESIIKTAVKKAINTEKPKKVKKEETVLTVAPGKFDDINLENKAKKPSKKGSK